MKRRLQGLLLDRAAIWFQAVSFHFLSTILTTFPPSLNYWPLNPIFFWNSLATERVCGPTLCQREPQLYHRHIVVIWSLVVQLQFPLFLHFLKSVMHTLLTLKKIARDYTDIIIVPKAGNYTYMLDVCNQTAMQLTNDQQWNYVY